MGYQTYMPTNQFSVAGSTALVTGASRGIGRTIADRFAADGANVLICSRTRTEIEEAAVEMDASNKGSVVGVECDVTDRERVEATVATTSERFGSIDVLVNNAGTSQREAFADISPEEWRWMLDVNLTGAFHCSQVAGEQMAASDGGTIVNISSVTGIDGSPNSIHYGVAKAGLINLTRALGHNWADLGIRVNCIACGSIVTPALIDWVGGTENLQDVHRSVVDRRLGLREEVADVVQFLASRASSFITGETIRVQGVPRIPKPEHD